MLLSDASCPTTSLIKQQSIVVSAGTHSGLSYSPFFTRELELIDSHTMLEHVMADLFSESRLILLSVVAGARRRIVVLDAVRIVLNVFLTPETLIVSVRLSVYGWDVAPVSLTNSSCLGLRCLLGHQEYYHLAVNIVSTLSPSHFWTQ